MDWTCKDLDHHGQDYVLMPTVWQAICEATYNAGKIILAARVPNIASEKVHMIAKTYSIWTLHTAPILLKGQFRQQQYSKHFIQLVKLLKLVKWMLVDNLENGFQSWVLDYEKCVFLFFLCHDMI